VPGQWAAQGPAAGGISSGSPASASRYLNSRPGCDLAPAEDASVAPAAAGKRASWGWGAIPFRNTGCPRIAWPFSGRRRTGRRGPDAGRRLRGQHAPPAGPAARLLDATRAAFTSGLQVTAVIFAALAQAFSQVIADPSYRRSGWLGAADSGAPAGSCSARTGHPHCAVADTNGSSRRETRRYAASYPAAEPSHGVPQSLHPH
jgi:hypothetical protein